MKLNIKEKLIQHNFDSRGGRKPFKIVMHTYGGPAGVDVGSLHPHFNNPTSYVSAHYAVLKNGTIEHYVPDHMRAWHAGNAQYNADTIGIEHWDGGNWADDVRTPEMYEASANLVASLCINNNIPCTREFVIPHKELSPNRECPGGLDIDNIIKRAQEIIKAEDGPGIVPELLEEEKKYDHEDLEVEELKSLIQKLILLLKKIFRV
jgi:N-acetyl-anhydromuramyl-L-alanine amidase AmpD